MEERNKLKKTLRIVDGLDSKGVVCALGYLERTTNGIVMGRIVRICQLFQMGNNCEIQSVQMIYLEELLTRTGESPMEFRCVVYNEVAERISSLNLPLNSYIAVRKPVVMKSSLMPYKTPLHKSQIVTGLYSSNSLDDVFIKWKNHWKTLVSLVNETSPYKQNDVTENECNPESIKSNGPYRVIKMEREDSSGFDSVSSSPAQMINEQLEELKFDNTNFFTCASKRPKVCFREASMFPYTKIIELKERTYNVYGIVDEIELDESKTLADNINHHFYIRVVDELLLPLTVHVYCQMDQNLPMLQERYIIRFHRLKVRNSGKQMHGLISNLNDVVIFDPNNEDVIYSTAKEISYTDEDQRRLTQLKQFLLDDYVICRQLKTLELDMPSFRLRCEVVEIKHIDESKTMLRVSDGTITHVPCVSIPFIKYCYLVADSKSRYIYREYTDEIDITVFNPDESFKTLVVGDDIQLNRVEPSVLSKPIRKVPVIINRLQFSLNGRKRNLIILSKRGQHDSLDKGKKQNGSTLNSKPGLVDKRCDSNMVNEGENTTIRDVMEQATDDADARTTTENIVETQRIPLSQQEDETAEMVKDGTTITYYKRWPLQKLESPFYIAAHLIDISPPSLNENSSIDEVMSLMSIHCKRCSSFYPACTVKWTCSNGLPKPNCPECISKDDSKTDDVEYLLMCNLSLEDESGRIEDAVIIGKHAERFFGCTVDELCVKEEVRRNVMDTLQKCMFKLSNCKTLNLFRMVGISNSDNSDSLIYHVFDTTCCSGFF